MKNLSTLIVIPNWSHPIRVLNFSRCTPSYTDKKVSRPNFPRVTLTKMVQWPNLNNW